MPFTSGEKLGIGLGIAGILIGGFGVFEGINANLSGKRLTKWANDEVVEWTKHQNWHAHNAAIAAHKHAASGDVDATTTPTEIVPAGEARTDHIPPPPPPPPW
jgi:hypothetical protein